MTTTKLESQHRLVFHTRSRIPHCLRRNKRRHLLLTLLCLLALRDSRGHGDTSKRRRGNYGEDDVDDFSPRHRRRRPPPPQQSRSRSQPQPPFPGNLHHVYDDPFDDSNGKPNYFERHRMLPPPILSRSDRHRQRHRRRQLQEEPREEEDGDGSNATHGDLESESNLELETIAEEARRGDDPASRLRADLLRQYDRNSYPWEYAWASQYGNEDQWEAVYRTGDDNDYDDGENVVEGADKLESTNVTPTSLSPSSSFTSSSSSSSRRKYGVPVELDINFHRVFHVDVISPTIDMIVWFRLLWADPRLTWDPVDYGNLTKTWFYVADGSAGGETSELWTPDIQLWNLETGLAHGLEDAYAIVQHDGRVYWSRPGHLRPACKFDGLDRFPFDHLTCQMEFGSWAFSGKYIRLAKADGVGFNVGGSDTAGQSYNEFSFLPRDPIQCRIRVYPPYPSSEDEDWPVLLYDVTVRRAWQPYVRGYLTVQTLLNVIGFSAFWLPPPCGERMGLSISAILAAVASEIVISANLPQASEYTWFQKFSLLSLAFAFLSLMESVVVLYFYYKRSEDMVPWWFTKARMWYWERQKKAIEASVEVGSMAAEKGRDTVVRAKDSLVSVGAKIVNNDNDNDNVHKDVDGDTEGHRNCNIQQSVSHKRASFKENGDDGRHADGLDDLNEGKSEMRETQQQQYLTTTVDENGDDHDGNWDDDYHRDDDNIITPRTGTAVKHANPSYQLDSVTNTADDIMIDDRNLFDTANETALFAAVTASPTPTTQSRNQSQRQSSQSAEEHYRNSFQSSISSLGNSKEVLEKLKLPNSRGMETSSAPPVVLLGESNRNEATSTVPRIGLRSSLRSSGRFHTMATQPSQYNPSKMEPHSANSAPSAIPNDTARRPSALRSSAYDPRHMETTSRPNRRRSRPGPERSRRRLLVDAESAHDFRMMHGGVGVGGGGERGWGGMDNESTMSLVVGPRDADDFNNEDEIENNLYWKLVAARIDDVARFWVPFTFVICLAVVLAEVM